jgi:hypothetical protein
MQGESERTYLLTLSGDRETQVEEVVHLRRGDLNAKELFSIVLDLLLRILQVRLNIQILPSFDDKRKEKQNKKKNKTEAQFN